MSTIYGYSDLKNKIDEVFDEYGEKAAIVGLSDDGNQTLNTFQEILSGADKLKVLLKEVGIGRAERIALLSPHSPYAAACVIQLAYIGVTAVLLDASLPTAELTRLIHFSDLSGIITTDSLYKKFNNEIFYNISVIELVQAVNGYRVIKKTKKKITNAPLDQDVIAICFSSGTTSEAKGVMVTYNSVYQSIGMYKKLFNLNSNMTLLNVLPCNHIAGYSGIFQHLLNGSQIAVPTVFNVTNIQNHLTAYNPSLFAMIPKFYETVEQKMKQAIKSKGFFVNAYFKILLFVSKFLRKYFGINIGKTVFKNIYSKIFGTNIFGIGTGSSQCKKSTTEFFLNLGFEWANFYASTESMVPCVTTGIFDKYPNDTVGKINRFENITVKINNPNENGIGEIYVKSPLLFKGYYKDQKATKDAFDGEYFKTGDLGYIDKKDYLHLTGRIKETVILQGGKKVSPTDIDHYYSSVCKNEIASCGIRNPKTGYDEVYLFVKKGKSSNEEIKNIESEIHKLSKKSGNIYKISKVCFLDDIPKTAIGKIKRFQLADYISTDKVGVISGQDKPRSFEEKILSCLNEFNKNNIDLTLSTNIRSELGLDSLDMLDLSVKIENITGKDISGCLSQITNIGSIIELIDTSEKTNRFKYNINDYPFIKDKKDIKELIKYIKFFSFPYNIKIFGKENIPYNENIIICSNHVCNLDSFWILYAIGQKVDLNKIAGLAACERLNGHFSKTLFNLLGEIPVERYGNTVPSIRKAIECLQNGYSLIVFPEGSRSHDGSMLEFKNGASKIASETGKHILPVRIDGAFEVFPRYKRLPSVFNWKRMKRHNLYISFGLPINPYGKTVDEITDLIRKSIMEMEPTVNEYRN